MSRLSVIIIAKNEEEAIRSCLQSIAWADEIIVVDDESTDATVAVAEEFKNTKIFKRKMIDGFGIQKQFALDQATGDWALCLDADEQVTAPGKQEIMDVMARDEYEGFYFCRRNLIFGRFEDDQTPRNLRLFKRDLGKFTTVRVHEEVIVRGRVGTTSEPIVHFSRNVRSVAAAVNMANRYSSLSAKDIYKKGRRITMRTAALYLFCYPVYLFTSLFIGKGYCKKGMRGFILAFLRALEGFLNYTKLWELQQQAVPESSDSARRKSDVMRD